MSRRPRLDLVLVGFGNVGRRLVTLLDETRDRVPFDSRVVAILTRRHGGLHQPSGLDAIAAAQTIERGGSLPPLSTTLHQICRTPHSAPRVVVETTVLDITAGEPAISHVRTALESGAHVVSANKGPVAFRYRELADLADGAGVRFLFEGAVMDGIPVFNAVRETMPAVRVTGFRGVINATTNHILTMMGEGQAFEAALAEMQRQGIAEADPSFDVDGWDAAAKTAALMNVWMDARVTPHDIERSGIREVTAADVREAASGGCRLRLVASAGTEGGVPRGKVRVERLPLADPLAPLEGMQNAIYLQTDLLGEVGIVQRDGGLTQTAYALLSDLTAIARQSLQ